MTIAVIKTGGKQYKIKDGQALKIEKIEGEAGKKTIFAEVLLVSDDMGEKVEVGTPTIKDKKVEADILEQGRAKKILVIKYKPKTRYRRKVGHRQPFTKVKIVKI